MKKFILASVICLFTNLAVASTGCEDLAYNHTFPQTVEPVTVLCKNGFAVGYSEHKKTLLWVVEKLGPDSKFVSKARPPFHKDSSLPANEQSSNSDFVGTTYDKGHMVPFEDMSYSPQSAFDSMSLTNIVPQNFSNNRGGWKSLEMHARKLSRTKVIYIISGPIFDGKTDYLNRSVPIPTRLFKIIIDPEAKTSVTYILRNVPVSAHEAQDMKATRHDVAVTGTDPTPGSSLTDIR